MARKQITLTTVLGLITHIARDNFEIFRSKRVVQPKYVHIPTFQSLGILDEVQSLMSSLGIWNYCTSPMPAYRTLTYEFLSTIDMENDDLLQYYLDGREYHITLAELSNLMGFITNLRRHKCLIGNRTRVSTISPAS